MKKRKRESKEMKESSTMDAERNWAGLIVEVLHTIYTILPPDLQDHVRLRSVCKQWACSIDSFPGGPPPKLPWLLECKDPNHFGGICPQPNLAFYSLADGKTGVIRPGNQHGGEVYYGPGHGYLLVCVKNTLLHLLNPITGHKIMLPELDHNLWIDSQVCSGLGPTKNWYIVTCVVEEDDELVPWRCVIHQPDTNSRTSIDIDGSVCYATCYSCCLNGMLYATDLECPTGVYDAVSGKKLYEVPQPEEETSFLVSSHLVECSGQVVRVCLYYDDVQGKERIKETCFEIYKLCSEEVEGEGEEKHFWVNVSDIGNRMMFLDATTGFSVEPPPGYTGNCIYFMSDTGSNPTRYDIGTKKTEKVRCPFERSTWFFPSLG